MGLYQCKPKAALGKFILPFIFLVLGIQGIKAGNTINGDPGTAAPDFSTLATSISDAGMGQQAQSPVAIQYDSLWTTLALVVGVLIVVALLLLFIIANLINLVRVREGKEAFDMEKTMKIAGKMALNPYIFGLGNFVALIVALIIVVPIARGVGLSQGYKPEQPIPYSHKIHAGTLQIDCQYCHTGASKGKNAWIPSMNVCMNCHKAVQESTIWPEKGTAGIKTLLSHWEKQEPIKWVRIHNLPDLAYFNHRQHVVVGGLQCQQCHGPIEEMDEVYQFSNLSMGWCVKCHRETEVNPKLYHEVFGRKDVKTVEDIGGLDCARCHY